MELAQHCGTPPSLLPLSFFYTPLLLLRALTQSSSSNFRPLIFITPQSSNLNPSIKAEHVTFNSGTRTPERTLRTGREFSSVFPALFCSVLDPVFASPVLGSVLSRAGTMLDGDGDDDDKEG